MRRCHASPLRTLLAQQDIVRVVLYALGVNVVIAIARSGGALLTASGALLIEASRPRADWIAFSPGRWIYLEPLLPANAADE
ncbi:MAG TPA: hypothetical protein VGK37_09700 [Casimicrobiaceae bacterium]